MSIGSWDMGYFDNRVNVQKLLVKFETKILHDLLALGVCVKDDSQQTPHGILDQNLQY